MDIDSFRALLDAHGGDPARWPETARDDALVLLATEPAARAVLDEARRLDSLIRAAAPGSAGGGAGRDAAARDTAVLDRLKAIPAARPQITVIEGGRGAPAATQPLSAKNATPVGTTRPAAPGTRQGSGHSPAFVARLGGAVAAAALVMGLLIGGNGWVATPALALDGAEVDLAAVLYGEQGSLEEAP
ncbi:hypothetical protein [uncultured Tistrella sp.]|uniref:hypothetical protein n=1 Tax=Tistrella mobilis TaxID=171437 RepID=UPI000C0A799A|nr:hypothetical protein [uncultured Tistrella sp.]MAM73360.1 hypothetical protein [Tistrella sp.]